MSKAIITYLNYLPPTLLTTNITSTVHGYYKPFLLAKITKITNTITSLTFINIVYKPFLLAD